MKKGENYQPPVCPDCGANLERVGVTENLTYTFQPKSNQYTSDGDSSMFCLECHADLYEVFPDGVCNYGPAQATMKPITTNDRIEHAYERVQRMLARAEAIEKNMSEIFQYSPFHLSGKIKDELRGIRMKLIEHMVGALRLIYMPNAKPPDTSFFEKQMSEAVGKDFFKICVLEDWFKRETADPEKLKQMSYEHILDLARNFVPMTSDGQEWGIQRNPRKLLEGNKLILRAYTWRTAGAYTLAELSWSMNDRGQYQGFEKFVDVITRGSDPTTVAPDWSWLMGHIRKFAKVRGSAEQENFYGKHEIQHPTVDAFQFLKNSKFYIWFKTPEQAEKVAYALCGKRHEQTALESNPEATGKMGSD